jgi:integrase
VLGRQVHLWFTPQHWGGRQIFKKAAKKAGLSDDVTPHDLRHHYASELLAAGESVVTVAARLGHNNANTVLKTYGHLVANQDDRTRQAIDRLWAAATTAKDVEISGQVVDLRVPR